MPTQKEYAELFTKYLTFGNEDDDEDISDYTGAAKLLLGFLQSHSTNSCVFLDYQLGNITNIVKTFHTQGLHMNLFIFKVVVKKLLDCANEGLLVNTLARSN